MPYLDQTGAGDDPYGGATFLRSGQKVLRHSDHPTNQIQLRRDQAASPQMAGDPTLKGVAIPRVVLKPKEAGRLQRGHLWAFSNEVAQAPAGIEPGSLADLVPAGTGFIGRGFYHPHSLIAFRVLSPEPEDINVAFFEKRLLEA